MSEPTDYNDISNLFRVFIRQVDEDGNHLTPPKPLEQFFSLHYDASRVNFSYHQRKTLAFVAWLAKNSIADQPKIAVLGGGIGGVTCYLGLKWQGMKNVFLFESGQDLIGVQKDCTHRHGHPTAIDWPNIEHSATTDLPLLNWGAGTAHEVREQLLNGTDEARFLSAQMNVSIFCNRVVKSIRRSDSEWLVESNPSGEGAPSAFDIVIDAMGFGQDRDIHFSRAESYWWEDNLENYLRDRHHYDDPIFNIVGGGDGGLIDFCRAALGLGSKKDKVPEMIAAARHSQYQWPRMTPPKGEKVSKSSYEKGEVEKIVSKNVSGLFQNLSIRFSDSACITRSFKEFRDHLNELVSMVHSGGTRIELISSDLLAEDSQPRGSRANILMAALLKSLDSNCLSIRSGRLEKTLIAAESDTEWDTDIFLGKLKFFDGSIRPISTGISLIRTGADHSAYLTGKIALQPDERVARIETADNFALGEHLSTSSRRDVLLKLEVPEDELADDSVVTWAYRRDLAEFFFVRILKIENANVRIRRTSDEDFFVELWAPIEEDGIDAGKDLSASKRQTHHVGKSNRQKIMESGGFDHRVFGGEIFWQQRDPHSVRYKGSAVWKVT